MKTFQQIISLIFTALSVKILKRYLNVETGAYRKWRNERADHIQRLLDIEHEPVHPLFPSF